MVYTGSKLRFILINYLFGLLVTALILGLMSIFIHKSIPIHLLVILPLASALGASTRIWKYPDVTLEDSYIEGPGILKGKTVSKRILFQEIQSIHNGIPMLSNFYIQSSDGSKLFLLYPYLSLSQIKTISELLKKQLIAVQKQ